MGRDLPVESRTFLLVLRLEWLEGGVQKYLTLTCPLNIYLLMSPTQGQRSEMASAFSTLSGRLLLATEEKGNKLEKLYIFGRGLSIRTSNVMSPKRGSEFGRIKIGRNLSEGKTPINPVTPSPLFIRAIGPSSNRQQPHIHQIFS